MVQAQITPIPTPRSSPVPSPAPTEHEHSNLREEPSLEVEEHKLSFMNNSYEPSNREHVQNAQLPSVEVIGKRGAILNGFVGQSKAMEGKRSLSENETLELNETAHQPINR